MSVESAPDVRVASPLGERPTQHYGTIVVVGGGCYGSYYVQQLERASAANALRYERLLVVDRNPDCRVAIRNAKKDVGGKVGSPPQLQYRGPANTRQHRTPAPIIVLSDWSAFFDSYFAESARTREASASDAIVPSPLMPHLMYEWLVRSARARWPGRSIAARPLDTAFPVPWQRADPSGTHYVSFAEWMCPVNCIEPRLCPETRGTRTWSMPSAVSAYLESERQNGRPLAGQAIFHCSHRAYGVGMFDTADVLAADALIDSVAALSPANVLVGTVSHCHGALTLLSIGERA
ncbi:MAG: hypothetical protein ACR2G6_17470 [Gemmatimonadaceae bacterium]